MNVGRDFSRRSNPGVSAEMSKAPFQEVTYTSHREEDQELLRKRDDPSFFTGSIVVTRPAYRKAAA